MKTDPNWNARLDDIYRDGSQDVWEMTGHELPTDRLTPGKAVVVVLGACALIWGGIGLLVGWW